MKYVDLFYTNSKNRSLYSYIKSIRRIKYILYIISIYNRIEKKCLCTSLNATMFDIKDQIRPRAAI